MILLVFLTISPVDLSGLWVCEASQARTRLVVTSDGYMLTGSVVGRLQSDIASPHGWAFITDSWYEAKVTDREITIYWQRQRTNAGFILSDVTRLRR
jgi:hypothetical protein